jgi:hypothetical protein
MLSSTRRYVLELLHVCPPQRNTAQVSRSMGGIHAWPRAGEGWHSVQQGPGAARLGKNRTADRFLGRRRERLRLFVPNSRQCKISRA